MMDLAGDWFQQQKHPATARELRIYLQYFAASTDTAYKAWNSHAESAWQAASTWSMETVKHLAIVNVAGIAGAAALYSQSPGIGFKVSVIAFMAGLVLAVLDFWLVSCGYSKRAIGAYERARAVRNSKSWAQYVEADGVPYRDLGIDWFQGAAHVGWTSAVAAIAGGLALSITLLIA